MSGCPQNKRNNTLPAFIRSRTNCCTGAPFPPDQIFLFQNIQGCTDSIPCHLKLFTKHSLAGQLPFRYFSGKDLTPQYFCNFPVLGYPIHRKTCPVKSLQGLLYCRILYFSTIPFSKTSIIFAYKTIPFISFCSSSGQNDCRIF